LADGLAQLPGLTVAPSAVETNIVLCRVDGIAAPELTERLSEHQVKVLAIGPDMLRAVTSLAVDGQQIRDAVQAFEEALG
jgi:threonine aldolase